MIKFIQTLLIFTSLCFLPAHAIEAEILLPEGTPLPQRDMNADGTIDQNDVVTDNVEENFYNFEHFDDSIDKNLSIGARIEKALKSEVTHTDYANHLLKDVLTFEFNRGPLERVQFYGKYRGNLSVNFFDGDTDTEYDNKSIDLGVVGEFSHIKDTDFKVQFKFTPTKDRTFFQQLISDAYIVNKSIPHHQIFIGNSRNQVGVEGGMTTTFIPFIHRAQIARNFGNVRAFGLKIAGKYDLADYSVAVNSSDRYFREFFPGAEITSWINFKPLGKTNGKYGKLVAGTGISTGRRHSSYTVGGAYLGYTYKNFFANAEYSKANGYNGRYLSTNHAQGFYTTLGYKITPKIEILGRADYFDPNVHISKDTRKEYTVGINYYIVGQALKLLLNYVFCDNKGMKDSHRIIIGTQILL